MKAQNIFLDENTGGKGRYFKSRFLQPGLVKYSFGVCVLDKATIDKFIQGFVGCPVIIGHKDVTNASAKDDRVGVISRIWYDNADGWFWGEGIIFDEKAISLVESGYNVSCQYDITEYSNNTTKALHNGNPYDKVILNGKPEHLAIVENPRYENAMIAVNALDMTAENEEHWITIGAGEDTKGHHVLVRDGETHKEAAERKVKEWEEKGKESGNKKVTKGDDFEKRGYFNGGKNRWHQKKDGKMFTIVKTTPDKYRFVVSEWDEKKGSGEDLYDLKSISREDLEKELNRSSDYFNKQSKNKYHNYLEDKIASWYKDAEIDYDVKGKMLDTSLDGDSLTIKWEEQKPGEKNKQYKMTIPYASDYSAAQLYDIWSEQSYEPEEITESSDKSDTKEDFEKETKSTKKDEERHQKVRDLEDKAYKEFKTIYDNYIHDNDMEGWGHITGSQFGKATEKFNKKYKDAFDKLESDRFVSFEDFAKRENKQSDSKGDSKDSGTQAPKKINYTLTKKEVAGDSWLGGMADTGSYYTNGNFVLDKNYMNLKGQPGKKVEDLENTMRKHLLGNLAKENLANYKYQNIKDFEVGTVGKKEVAKYTYKDDNGDTKDIYVDRKYNNLFKNFDLKFGSPDKPIYAYDCKNLIGAVIPIDVGSRTFTKAENEIDRNTIIQAINEIKDNNMFRKLFNLRKEKTMEKDEMKSLFIDCIQDVLKAQNEEDVEDVEFEEEEEEEKAENKKCKNKKCKNEDVDKRKLIDEVAGIMKSAGCDDEVIRTAIAKMEKIGYDKSEAATADNSKKAKCEDEEEKEIEDAKNKAKNSIEELKGILSSAGIQKPASKYMTKSQAIELGNQLF